MVVSARHSDRPGYAASVSCHPSFREEFVADDGATRCVASVAPMPCGMKFPPACSEASSYLGFARNT